MSRLIDADELKNILEARYEQCEGEYGSLQGAVSGFIKLIDIQTTVDAEPVRHGKWIETHTWNGFTRVNRYTCSFCEHNTERLIKTDFCPNCGAKMTGGKRK